MKCLGDKDGRVGVHEKSRIGAIGSEGCWRASNGGHNNCRLYNNQSIQRRLSTAQGQFTLVCQTAIEDSVIVANR